MQPRKQIVVALACVFDNQKILLTKRGEKEQLDIDEIWELPGGKVEFNESPLDTVIREVKEETGCDVSHPISLPFPYVAVRNYKDSILHVIIFCFECQLIYKSEDFSTDNPKILDIQWFDVEDIKFMDIMAGSREFIHWAIRQKYGKNFEQSQFFQSFIHFEVRSFTL
jgi:8-oxo-dGTP diphosphatase